MEKRTVRIYKAPDGQGKFINKTSQFLQKAQQGAQVQQSQENRMQQYAKLVYDKLSNEDTPEEVYDVLVQQGLSSEIAQAMISQIMQKMIDNGELDPAYNENDEAEEGEQQEAPEEEQQASVNAEEEEATESYMPYAEDETVEEEEGNEPWATDMYQQGGEAYVSNQYDDQNSEEEEVQDYESLVENTPGKQSQLQFSNTDAYLPDYTPLAWENIEALQPQQSLKHGGMPSKKSFVKNVMSIIKRQAGGEGADKSNSVGKGNPFDTYTNTLEKRKTGFLSTLKDQTTKAKTEDIYKKLMSSNDPELHKVASTLAGQEQAPQDYGFPEQPYAQTGGFTGGEDPLYRFVYGGDEDVNPEYYDEGMLPEAQDGKSVEKKDTDKKAVDPWEGYEIKKAKVTYTPRVKTTAGGLRGTLLPWNPIGRVTGQIAKQVGTPYYINNNTPYTGSMQGQIPIGRHVTKTTMFGRRPKEWVDIYQLPAGYTQQQTSEPSEKLLSREELAAERKKEEIMKMQEDTRNKKSQPTVKPANPTITDNNAESLYESKYGYQYGGNLGKYFPGGPADPSAINKRKSDPTSMMTDQEGYLGAPIGRPTFGRSETYAEVNRQNAMTAARKEPMTSAPITRSIMTPISTLPGPSEIDPKVPEKQILQQKPEYVGVKNKAKNKRLFDGETSLNVFNAGAQGALGMIDRIQKAKQEGQMMENEFNADNLYGASTAKDRGDTVDYGSQLGQYRFDQMGQDRSSRFSYGQEGGYMQEGGFAEGEEVEMTEAELADFIANGGEVEYI